MAGVTFILQLHQPYVLAKYDALAPGPIIDLPATRRTCQQFAMRSIHPVHQVLSEVAGELSDRFRVTCLVSGVALEIFARFQPDVIASLRRLADAGVMDFAVTPYHHGLSCLVDADEFARQIGDSRNAVGQHLGSDSVTLANTAMLYSDRIGQLASEQGILTVICCPAPKSEADSSAHVSDGVARGVNGIGVVMCDGRMSSQVGTAALAAEDGAIRLPAAPEFASNLADRAAVGGHRTVIWEYQTFGWTLSADTGVFAFLRHLPGHLLDRGFERFQYCCDAVGDFAASDTYRPHQFEGVSVDGFNAIETVGDPMISHAHNRLYSLKDKVLCSGLEETIQDWRRMQAWDHFRGMGDADSLSRHRWSISGADSGYEGYVIFMGHCDTLASRVGEGRHGRRAE